MFSLRRKMPACRWFAEGRRQRFYARNGLKTTLGPLTALLCPVEIRRLMRSFSDHAVPSYPTRIQTKTKPCRPALRLMWVRWCCLSSWALRGVNCHRIRQGVGFSWVFASACIIAFECGPFDLVDG